MADSRNGTLEVVDVLCDLLVEFRRLQGTSLDVARARTLTRGSQCLLVSKVLRDDDEPWAVIGAGSVVRSRGIFASEWMGQPPEFQEVDLHG
jgi:hypothetical protein